MDQTKHLTRRGFLSGSAKLGAMSTLAWTCSSLGAKHADASEGKAPPYMIGCYTRPWAQYEYRVALDAIAEAGYKYVGLMTTKGKGIWFFPWPRRPRRRRRSPRRSRNAI